MEYRKRQTALRQRMAQGGVDGLLVTHLPNVRYLCGFSGSNALLLVSAARALLFTDGRYREQARQQVVAATVVVPPQGDLWKAAAARAARLARIGLDSDHLSVAQRARWLAHWAGKANGLKAAEGWIEALRAVKEPEEIEAIARAVRLASSALLPTLKRYREGMAETELAGWLEFALRRAGGEGLAFDTILAGGAHGALVHAQPSRQPLPPHGFVVIDYGVILAGYHSDMTRTVHIGKAGSKQRSVYQAVLDAQLAALAAVRPGATGAAVDAAARRSLRQAGYGNYFPHSTGHGVGLEIHEAPRLAARASECLQAGQVITIEPGVYIPGWGGVRIEDVVQVTEGGAKVLTPSPKELLIL
ncbi:MAG: M24 family metallopeptidase [Terriglobales bacterium]